MATKQQRIKGMKKKISSAIYTPFIPFGTDGKLVDMLDGLNLEEDLIIGGDHYSTIQEIDNTTTIISEIFAKQEEVKEGTAENYYKIDTTLSIDEDENTIIERKLWFVTNSSLEPELVHQKLIKILENELGTMIEEVLDT